MSLTIRKRGKFWYARGTVPARQADGSISRVRIEESTRTESKVRAREIASDIERYYHDLAYGRLVKRGPTFAEAAITYIQTRGRSDHFVTKLIQHFGTTPISDIDQAAAANAAFTLYPGCAPATHLRAVFTPLSAMGVQGLKRPKAESAIPDIPPDDWFDTVLSVAPPKLCALLLFVTLTGRRVGEAIGLKNGAIKDGWVTIPKTKTGKPVHVKVPEICLEYLSAPNPKGYTGGGSKHLFGYHSLQSAHVALTHACKKAGVPKFGFHAAGRHSFATRALKAGKSTKWVKEAGGWDSIRSLDRYLHLEQSEVRREADLMGQHWGSSRPQPLKKA